MSLMLRIPCARGLLALAVFTLAGSAFAVAGGPEPDPVDPAVLQRIYEEVKTPYKYGIVLRAPPGRKVDCPNVFRFGGRWYMV
ncbi:MAG: hypothetical protein N2438_04735, partial [Limisphaera sp.]|nr:hypothetical protein [Limisphaera sp.]